MPTQISYLLALQKDTSAQLHIVQTQPRKYVGHFLFDCTGFREHFDLLWSSLSTKVIRSNPTDGNHISDFLVNLEQHQKALLLIGCLPLPFDSATIMMITRFVASAVGKIYKLCTEKLRELEAPWIAK